MTVFIALLRAVNVGGTGKLPMTALKALCERAGFGRVRTYIASGNVLFDSDLAEPEVKATIEQALHVYAGKPVGVLMRTAAEMAAVVAANPFAANPGDRVVAIFLDAMPPDDAAARVTGRQSEEIGVGAREIYVHYPDGIGRSKLRIKVAETGTARNMNTVATLARMADAVG
jgi:uncharacterized protein (DUF1697 family)